VEARKAAKAAERPPPSPSATKRKTENDEELAPHVPSSSQSLFQKAKDVQKHFENRSKEINALRETKNPDPYPHKFATTTSIPEFVEKYSHLKRGEQLKETEVALAGRIMVIRDNKKLKFYDLHGDVFVLMRLS